MISKQLTLNVFYLNEGAKQESYNWMNAMQQYFSKDLVVKAFDFSKNTVKAPFFGAPFIWVGRQNEIEQLFTQLSKEAISIVNDCAYYWLVSETPFTESNFPGLIDDRKISLSWKLWKNGKQEFNVIKSQIKWLNKCQELKGLSRGLHKVRIHVDRIANGPMGPGKPVLILGESGSGKELVARAISQLCPRDHSTFNALACGWLTEQLLQDQLFGHVSGAYTGAVNDKKGLLELNENGIVFLDDFDAAPISVQAALLRFLSTPEYQYARFLPLGGDGYDNERESYAWLFFSTNKNIEQLIADNLIREDFIFRFEDRVIKIPALRDRPADMPSLITFFWQTFFTGQSLKTSPKITAYLVKKNIIPSKMRQKASHIFMNASFSLDTLKMIIKELDGNPEWLDLDHMIQEKVIQPVSYEGRERFPVTVIEWLCTSKTDWKGNIRALYTLLSLCAVMAKNPDYNHCSFKMLLQQIMNKGPEYYHWMEIMEHFMDSSENVPVSKDKNGLMDEIRNIGDSICLKMAIQKLSKKGTNIFERIQNKYTSDRQKPCINRLSRLILFVAGNGHINKQMAHQVTGIKSNTPYGDLRILVDAGILAVHGKGTKSSKHVYTPVDGVFNI
jgi:DNA-binding NtrC family response regulator